MERKEFLKFKTTVEIFFNRYYKYHELELKTGQEQDFFVVLGDLVAPDVDGQNRGLETFLDSLTKLFSDLKDKETYKTLVPQWESFDHGTIRIFTNPEESF